MREKFIEKIFGAPGTGKTHTLIARLQSHLDKNCPFDKTLTTTFTKVAARHIKHRIQVRNHNKFNDKELHYSVKTIDSYLMSKINEDKDICYSSEFSREFHGVENESQLDDQRKRHFYWGMDTLKKGRIFVGDGIENILKYYDTLGRPMIGRKNLIYIAESYANYKKNHLKMDWEDVKYKGLADRIVFPENIVLMIDEAQDCNRLEWLVIKKLIGVSKNVYIAGDDDQAIYGFKGGEVETFLNFKVDKSTVLEESPRLNKKIWDVAEAAIHLIPPENRQEKKYKPTNINEFKMPTSGLLYPFRNKETISKEYLNMEITDPKVDIHWLILARTNKVLDMRYSQENYSWSQILASHYMTWEKIEESNGFTNGIERGTTPNIQPDQIRAIEIWLNLQKGEKILGKDVKEFYKIIPPGLIRDRKKTALTKTDSIILKDGQYKYGDLKEKFYLDADINLPWFKLLNLRPRPADKSHYVNYVDYLKKVIEKGNHKKSKRILLSTVHGAKGLESANTILNCDWTYRPYNSYCMGGKHREDELRIFYVGITRTKHNLFLYQPDFTFGEYKGMKHNNFWNKIRGK